MKLDINEIVIADDDNTTLGTIKCEDEACATIELKTIVSYEDIDEFCEKIKEGYFIIFPEHKDRK